MNSSSDCNQNESIEKDNSKVEILDILESLKRTHPHTVNQIENLIKDVKNLTDSFNLKDEKISKNILSTRIEIKNIYNTKPLTLCSKGDIIDANFGMHIHGELSGGHVYCIVYDIINEGMLYVIPIFKQDSTGNIEPEYLNFISNKDVVYNNKYNNCYVTLHFRSAVLIHPWRVNDKIGKAKPTFLKKLDNHFKKYQINRKTSISTNNSKINEINETLEIREKRNFGKRTEASKQLDKILIKDIKTINTALPLSEQIDSFLKKIDFKNPDGLIRYALLASLDLKKETYNTVAPAIRADYEIEIPEEEIIQKLKDSFSIWLFTYHPDIRKKSPRIGISTFLRSFSKNYKICFQ